MRFKLLARRIALAPALALALAADGGRLQQQFELVRDHLLVERSGRLLARRHRQFRRAEQPGHRVELGRRGADHRELGEVLQRQHPHRGKGLTCCKTGAGSRRPSMPSPACPLASGIGAKVTAVTVNSATKATVTYNLTSRPARRLLSNQNGMAVYQDGIWKVGDASLCGLFKLMPGGTVPSACNSAG